jgi:hypothetical protein
MHGYNNIITHTHTHTRNGERKCKLLVFFWRELDSKHRIDVLMSFSAVVISQGYDNKNKTWLTWWRQEENMKATVSGLAANHPNSPPRT